MTCYPSRSTILPNFIAWVNPRRRYPLQNIFRTYKQTKSLQTNSKQYIPSKGQHAYQHVGITSTPVIWTGVYPQMPIVITQPMVVSLSHMPRDYLASCHTWLTTCNALSIFHFLALGANPGAKVHQTFRKLAAKFQPDRANGTLIGTMACGDNKKQVLHWFSGEIHRLV